MSEQLTQQEWVTFAKIVALETGVPEAEAIRDALYIRYGKRITLAKAKELENVTNNPRPPQWFDLTTCTEPQASIQQHATGFVLEGNVTAENIQWLFRSLKFLEKLSRIAIEISLSNINWRAR